jgi:molecular chaperone DnaK (HSP70)
MGIRVGIDLGTTNSAVAVMDAHGQPVVLPNRLGGRTTPSVVCFRGGEVVVGQEAKELQAAGEPGAAAFFKRQMGAPGFVFHAAGRDHTAVDLSALVLRAVREDAERALGEPVTHAVITVPAYFRNPQREATIAAGRQAGLEVLQVVNEPTAAAVAYGLRGAAEPRTLLVYDLGGGTFDVTLLRLDRDELRVLHSDGDHELGGKDWDDRIVEFLANRFQEEHGVDPLEDRESIADLLVSAEEVKKRLSSTQSAGFTLVHEGRRGRYTMDRPTLDGLTADLMERTIALTTRVLADQGMAPAQVDGVLLVGGSTRMPMVHDFVRRTFGREPSGGVNPDEAVALGAAVVAAEHADPAAPPRYSVAGPTRRVDVTNHSLGMIALNESRSAFVNTLILPKNTPIPRRDTRPYQHRTRRGGANTLEVFVTQGESESPADVTYLGKYVLSGLLHAEGGVAVVDIEYSYDASGTVRVAARARAGGGALEVAVEPLPDDVPARFLLPPATPAPAPHVTAYLAFDLSGSMAGEPVLAAKQAARGFLANTDRASCSVGIIAFADREQVKAAATQNARTLERAIDGLTVGEVGIGNATDPFRTVLDLLKPVKGLRYVITLADGVWEDQPTAVRRAEACHAAGIESIAIGFGGADRDFLARIASSDEASFFTSLGGLAETFAGIAQVITEARGDGEAAPPAGRSLLARLRG